jgi:lysozyme family protein
MKLSEQWYNNIVKPWEGGVGNRPLVEDSGGLTNKGITIGTWISTGAKLVNKPPTAQGLLSITEAEADKIAQEAFWKKYKVDTVLNPALRFLVADTIWMSGIGNLHSIGYNSISDLNKDIFATPKKLYNNRLSWLKTLSNWKYNGAGWTNRLNANLKASNKILLRMGLIGGGSLLAITGTVLLIKHSKKQS